MDKKPEYMIVIAAIAAVVVCIIANAVACSAITAAARDAVAHHTPGYNELIENIEGGNNPEDLLDELLGHGGGQGGDENSSGNSQDGSESSSGSQDGGENGGAGNDGGDVQTGINGGFTEKDVPATMDIDVPELQDDLQACLNNVINYSLFSDQTITITELTKGEVAAPVLKGGRVLSQVAGKATIKNAEGKTQTVDYTSYYLAADPTAQKITWYIYGYDLSSYDLFPKGFKELAGDPMGVRETIENGVPVPSSELGRDRGQDARTA